MINQHEIFPNHHIYKSPPQTTVKKYPANRQKGFVAHASTRNCVSAAAANLFKQIDEFLLLSGSS